MVTNDCVQKKKKNTQKFIRRIVWCWLLLVVLVVWKGCWKESAVHMCCPKFARRCFIVKCALKCAALRGYWPAVCCRVFPTTKHKHLKSIPLTVGFHFTRDGISVSYSHVPSSCAWSALLLTFLPLPDTWRSGRHLCRGSAAAQQQLSDSTFYGNDWITIDLTGSKDCFAACDFHAKRQPKQPVHVRYNAWVDCGSSVGRCLIPKYRCTCFIKPINQ